MAQILSFSGGKDSTAMLHKMLEKGEQIDEILFFDTSWEWPQMYEHLALVEEKTGRKITRLRPEKPFDYFAFERLPERTKRIYKGYGWPSIKGRWCTRLKQETMDRYIKTHYDPTDLVQCVGFAVGEERRIRGRMADPRFRFPLIEMNLDEWACKDYCYELGYHWGGLYDYFNRVSCFCCPLQSKREQFVKKRHFPEIWERLRAMDRRIQQNCAEFGRCPGMRFTARETFLQIDSSIPESSH